MESKEKNINLFLLAIAPFGIGSVVWSILRLPPGRIDSGVITLTLLAVFCSSYLRIRLPRFNVHLTISDALIIISLFFYGGEVTVLVAVAETAVASFNLLRQGVVTKKRTILVNVFIAAIAVFATSETVSRIFGPTDIILQRADFTSFIWLLTAMAISFSCQIHS